MNKNTPVQLTSNQTVAPLNISILIPRRISAVIISRPPDKSFLNADGQTLQKRRKRRSH